MNKIITAVILLFSLSTVAFFTESYLMLYAITSFTISIYWFAQEENLAYRELVDEFLDKLLEAVEGAENNTNDK